MFVADETRRRIRQPMRHAYGAGAVAQRLLHPLDHPGVVVGVLLLLLPETRQRELEEISGESTAEAAS